MPDSPAEKAGLNPSSEQAEIDGLEINVGGDVITAIDGQEIQEMDDLIAYLSRSTRAGQEVTLTLLRNGDETQVEVTLAARPTPEERMTADTPPEQSGIRLVLTWV